MTWQDSLLIREASKFEEAVEATSASRWPLDWDLLRTLHDPDKIPADKLPILAWALSVDLWDPTWPIEKKRSVVRSAIRDHSLKGTIAGVRRHLEIEDGDLVSYKTPPQRLFASDTLSKEELDAWLEGMPQLRIYRRSLPGDGTNLGFADYFFTDYDFAMLDEAPAHYGRFPVLYDNGISIPLRTSEIITTTSERKTTIVEQVSSKGVGGYTFEGDFEGEILLDDILKDAALYTIRTDRTYDDATSILAVNTAVPGLRPLDMRFKSKSEIGDGGPACFIGDFTDADFFIMPDLAEWMLYDVIYLHDTARAIPLIDALSFADDARVSMDPFHSEYMVDAHTFTDDAAKFEGDFTDLLFAMPEDLSKIDRQLTAIGIAKGYRDKALVTFETTRPRVWGDGYPLDGSVPLWSRVDAAL